jgi:unsaturated rhamnogalacturonyl hydrolase
MPHKLTLTLLAGALSFGVHSGCGGDDTQGQTSGPGSGSGGAAGSTTSTSSSTGSSSSTATTSSAGGASMGGAGGAGGGSSGAAGSGGSSDDGGTMADASADAPRDAGGDAAPAFDRAAVIAVMKKVAQNQIAEHPPASTANDWINAAFYAGLMAAERTTGDATLRDAARSWSQAHNWDLGAPMSTNADNQCCTQTYEELYLEAPMPANAFMYQKIQATVDSMMMNPPQGRVLWWWCDSLFMAPGAFARLGAVTGQTKYFDFMNTLYWDSKAYLFDAQHSLFFRDKNFFGTTTFWSRGNGWVIAGIARILDYLPANDAHRTEYQQLFTTMAGALVPLQGMDGIWRSDLLAPTRFPNPEASGSGFFTFALAWGVHHGVLPRDTYLPVVRKAWTGLLTLVAADGRMQFVQPTGDRPAAAVQTDHLPFGAGAFLLAGSEVAEL